MSGWDVFKIPAPDDELNGPVDFGFLQDPNQRQTKPKPIKVFESKEWADLDPDTVDTFVKTSKAEIEKIQESSESGEEEDEDDDVTPPEEFLGELRGLTKLRLNAADVIVANFEAESTKLRKKIGEIEASRLESESEEEEEEYDDDDSQLRGIDIEDMKLARMKKKLEEIVTKSNKIKGKANELRKLDKKLTSALAAISRAPAPVPQKRLKTTDAIARIERKITKARAKLVRLIKRYSSF